MVQIPSLNILMLHNYYQHSGGEDVSMATEAEILCQAGHNVELLTWHNDVIKSMSTLEKLNMFWKTTWNPNSKHQVYEKLRSFKIDLMHVQNFFPLVSPSVYSSAHQLDIPVVQHLRNFRLGCLNSYLYRDGKVCEACVGRNPWRGVVYRCYRNSLPTSLSLWQMITVHRFRRTWHHDVNAFITPSKFSAEKLSELGIPSNKLYIKPNFIEDPLGTGKIPPYPKAPTFLFIGRLSPEKGVLELLKSWKLLQKTDWELWVVGDGPMRVDLEKYCQECCLHNVKFWGYCSKAKTMEILQKSSAILVPSHWYETFGRVVIEAFACGRAAIVSNLGALAELVVEGATGFKVPYASEQDWVDRLLWCGEHMTDIAQMGQQARQVYLKQFTPKMNYQRLSEIYSTVLS